jgi:uncharacterized protein (DUF1800 family)
MSAQGLAGAFRSFGRVVVAAALCGVMVDQPVLAEAAVSKTGAAPVQKAQAQIHGQERILHALNRFTFGPRPGDVEAVQKMGLKKWFEQQLNPASIDDSALDARLAQYPAMNLSIAQLMAKYPSPQMIRQMMDGKMGLPRDPQQRILVQDQLALYKIQKAKQEQAKADPAQTQPAPEGAPGMNAKAAADQMALDDAGDQALLPDHTARHEAFLKLVAMPPDQRYQAILAMQPQELVQLRQGARPAEQGDLAAGMTPEQKETLLALAGSGRMVALEEMDSRLERDIYSNRQLEAVMTDFWLNHFNVYVRKNQNEPFLIPTFERETIRPHALGNFEDLLLATAMSPAMLEYLDNSRSIGPNSVQVERAKMRAFRNPNAKAAANSGLNENYGRELMELHTLGVNGGYTQADVTNVAKVLTGWTIARPGENGSEGFTFIFDEAKHEPGSKQVLGQTIKEDSVQEGLKVLHMLATSPATAHFLSQKLAVRFVSDNPPKALVDRMAAAFLSSNGNIKVVLATMWNSPEFWSEDVYRAKVKTPEEFVVSAVRASGANVTNPAALVQALNKLGMPLYGMQTPQGYSWKQDDWVSTGALVSRLNFALVLAGDRVPGTQIAWNSLAGAGTAAFKPAAFHTEDAGTAKERRLEVALLGEPVSDRTRAAVMSQANDASVTEQAETQFDLRGSAGKGQAIYRRQALAAGGNAAPDDPQAAVMAGLLLGSPEFQRR